MFRRESAMGPDGPSRGASDNLSHSPSGRTGPGRETLLAAVGERLAGQGREATDDAVRAALEAILPPRQLGPGSASASLVRWICDELAGLGPVGPFMRDPEVTEIMINSPDEVYVERAGRLQRTPAAFRSQADVLHLIERVVSPLGLRVDASSPWVDARLPDGSRVHAVVPPLSLRGPTVTIRKFCERLWSLEDLVEMGSVSEPDACLLADAVRERRNLLVSGGAGSGKTTLLGVLARLVDDDQRVITIEDAAELRLGQRHVVSLEARPPNVQGRGEVTIRDLVRCAMRMRPDRIVVGEVRGPEALDMLQALTSGHAGSMATVHANAPGEALIRLETMALMAAVGLSVSAARRLVASAVELVVHVVREADGRRRVSALAEVRLTDEGPAVRRIRSRKTR